MYKLPWTGPIEFGVNFNESKSEDAANADGLGTIPWTRPTEFGVNFFGVREFGLEHLEGKPVNFSPTCLFSLLFPITDSNSGALTHSKPSIHFP